MIYYKPDYLISTNFKLSYYNLYDLKDNRSNVYKVSYNDILCRATYSYNLGNSLWMKVKESFQKDFK